VTVDDDIEVSGSSRFNIFTAISNMADRAANTFSDSFLPGVHKSLDQGHQGSQSPTRNKRRFKSKKHHQSSANFVDVIQGKFSKFEKKFPKRLPVPEFRSFKEDDRTKSKSTKSKFRKFLDGSSKKKFKFPGNNIKTVTGPDLSRQLLISDNDEDGLTTVTLRTTMSHFSVTPSPTSKGIFEIDPITIVTPTSPTKIRIIQPVEIIDTTRAIATQATQSPTKKWTPKFVSTQRPIDTTFRSIFSPRVPKQNSPALTFVDSNSIQTSRPPPSKSNDKFSSRQRLRSEDANDLPDLTPLGVRLSLEDMLRSTGDQVEMRPIPGDPGVDYPVFSQVPDTDFNCRQQDYPGIYTDTEAQCQVFHMCMPETGETSSFLCPNGTIFSQQYFVCDWWYNHDCAEQQSFANLNQFLYQESENEIKCKTLFCIND